MVFQDHGSNIYDIKNDKWLLDNYDTSVRYTNNILDDRVCLITDDFLLLQMLVAYTVISFIKMTLDIHN